MHSLLGVTLLLSLALAVAGSGCPQQCRCPETPSNLIFEVHCKNASLTELPTGDFQEAFFVDLSFNNITTLTNNTFFDKHMVKLLRLYLNHNGIKTIEVNTFRGLTDIKLLNLELNDIREISPNVFEDNVNLEVLNLNSNKNLQLPDTGLHLPALDILLLENCGLKTIPAQFFKNILNLQYLFLNANEISVFDPQLIKPLTQLKKLDLRRNKFTSLQFDLHENFPETLVIEFDGNPLHCDCELESTYSLNKEKKLYGHLTCGTPTKSSLHKFLLDSCNNTTPASLLVSSTTPQSAISNVSATSPPTAPLDISSTTSSTATSESTSHVIVPEDEDVRRRGDSSDRTDSMLDMDGYTSWLALSAVLLALVIVALITVFIRRRNKASDYVTPRRFTLLEYDDEEQSYVT